MIAKIYEFFQDNKVTFDVPLEVISDIRITGKSDPSVLEYNSTAGYASKYRVEDQLGKFNTVNIFAF